MGFQSDWHCGQWNENVIGRDEIVHRVRCDREPMALLLQTRAVGRAEKRVDHLFSLLIDCRSRIREKGRMGMCYTSEFAKRECDERLHQ